MSDSKRNLLILLALAVAGAAFTGAFGSVAGSASTLLNVAFAALIVWLVIVTYQRHSGTIAHMDVAPRLILQLSTVGLLLIFVTGTLDFGFLPHPPFGWQRAHAGIFYGALLLCAFGLWWSWQQRTSRW